MSDSKLPRVLIVGGGFGGIEVARRLKDSPVQVTIIDQKNYHLFQPLLYQVATATLSPSDIAAPIRSVVRDLHNCRVLLAKVRGVDLKAKQLNFEKVSVSYDWLVLAAGATHSYFGHEDWVRFAPGLKSLEDATEIRRRILLAFESAEYEGNTERQAAGLTFAVVGGGATGVELAGAIKEIAAKTMPKDFRNIDTKSTRVIVLQGEDRLLPQFCPELSEQAKHDLESMGVEVRLNSRVTEVTSEGVWIGSEMIAARSVFWAAGVEASPIAKTLGVPLDRSGRIVVEGDLTVAGHKVVFAIGDMAAAKSGKDQKNVPGVAQAAVQMGRYVGNIIASEAYVVTAKRMVTAREPFIYYDKGSMATIGNSRAVVEIGRFHFTGFFAWMLWSIIHIFFLVGFRNRLGVIASWFWNWLLSARDSRLITGEARLDIKEIRPGELVLQAELPK